MVSAAPGPLPSSSHALGTTDLDHLGDGAKVDPKIEPGGGLHIQRPASGPPLCAGVPWARLPWCSASAPTRLRSQAGALQTSAPPESACCKKSESLERLKKRRDLALGADCAAPGFCPGKAFDFPRDKRVVTRGQGARGPLDQAPATLRAEQYSEGVFGIGHGGREAPALGLRSQAIEAARASSRSTPRFVPRSACHSSYDGLQGRCSGHKVRARQ